MQAASGPRVMLDTQSQDVAASSRRRRLHFITTALRILLFDCLMALTLSLFFAPWFR